MRRSFHSTVTRAQPGMNTLQRKMRADNEEAARHKQEEKRMSTDYTTGTPWLCSELEGNVTLETEVSLKDDFFLAVCKDRILSIEVPPGFAAGGVHRRITRQGACQNRTAR